MNNFQQNFYHNVQAQPDCIAIMNSQQSLSYSDLAREIEIIGELLEKNHIKRLAIAMENSPAYICVDLACIARQIISVAVPHFFSEEQAQHLFENANANAVIVDKALNSGDKFHHRKILLAQKICIFGKTHWLLLLETAAPQIILPADTLKISYTSGTTGQPRGVIICGAEVDKVINSLAVRLNACAEDHHLSVLPYSLLLENIAGVYAVLAAGGRCMVPGFKELGFSGSSSLNIGKFINTVFKYQPTTMITVPALAQAFVIGTEQSRMTHKSLRFVAVGGAPLSESIIKKAQSMGLPLYQGYGLTESCSVVSLNTADENKTDSVGKPLDHIKVSISEDGEILVSGSQCAGYIDNSTKPHNTWATGDLGYLDKDGFLYITGRKRTSFCTAYGRNVSPEWVESELCAHPEISQAVIYGEGQPFNIAIVVPRMPMADDELNRVMTTTNKQLPDYAQISRWLKADEPYSVANGQLSRSGMIQRARIINDYQNKINSIYQ